jgi:phage-related baseplate assembly protein
MSNIKELQNVPEVSFVDNLALQDVREQIIKDYTAKYQEITGEGVVLSDADPVRLILLSFAQHFYQGLQYVDWAGKKNLLKYSYGTALDNLAANKGIIRNPASYAETVLRFSMQNVRESATGIPAGTRVSNLAGVYFMTSTYAEIPIGQTTLNVQAVALDAGAVANDLPVGSVNQIVDPVPYIYEVKNITISTGGADEESDDKLTERVFLYPASFSTAGAEAAYIYWAKTFRADVSDVSAYSPAPGKVTVLFMLNGGTPNEEDVAGMAEHLSAKTVRPLTDHVTVQAPAPVNYNINLTYYIDSTDSAKAISIQTAVTQAVAEYKTWQRIIGRDINPSELIRKIMDAGAKRVAVTAPVYTPVDSISIATLGTETVTYGGLEVG